jgi:hypothetical protein
MVALLIYPFSFFLAAAYTEGLFLTFTTLALLYARQGRWRLAAVMALLAGATRPTGVALIAPLAWEWLRQQGLLQPEQWRSLLRSGRAQVARDWLRALAQASRRQWAGLLAIAAVPAFIVALAAFTGLRFHHPSLIVNVRRDYWGLVSTPIWRTMVRELTDLVVLPFGSTTQIVLLLDMLCIVAATYGVIALCRRTPVAYTLYMIGLLYVSTAQATISGPHPLQGPGRYLLASIPLFLALGGVLERRPRLRVALICLGVALQWYVALSFLTGTLIE